MQWVEQPPLRSQLAVQEGEVVGKPSSAHVLGEADRRDGVEASLRDVAVVEQAHVGAAGEPRLGDHPPTPFHLPVRQRHAKRPHSIVPRRAQHQTAPAAADVQQAHPRTQPELTTHEVDLGFLRLLQRRPGLGVDGAGVDHHGPRIHS